MEARNYLIRSELGLRNCVFIATCVPATRPNCGALAALRPDELRLEGGLFASHGALENAVGLRHHCADALEMTTTFFIRSREFEVIGERVDDA